MTTDIIQHAQDLAARGFAVIPLHPNSKRPVGKQWEARATTDPGEIEERFRPNHNVGIFLGQWIHDGYNLLCIDVDDLQQWADLSRKTPALPDTFTVASRKGSHLYFQYPASRSIYTNVPGFPKIEIRSGNMQMVAPESSVDGHRYKVTSNCGVAVLPDEWLDLITRNAADSVPAAPEPTDLTQTETQFQTIKMCQLYLEKSFEIGRNNAGLLLAAQLRDLGYSKPDALVIATEWHRVVDDEHKGGPAFPLREVTNAVDQAYKRAPRTAPQCTEPTKAPPINTPPELDQWPPVIEPEPLLPPAYPLQVFDSVPIVKQMIEELANAKRTPIDYAASTVIGAVAAAAQNKYRLKLNADWQEHLSLMMIICGPPGTGKSQIVKPLTKILETLDREDGQQRIAKRSLAEATMEALAIEEKAIKKRLSQEKHTPEILQEYQDLKTRIATTSVPQNLSVIAEDATPEKAAIIAANNNGRVILISAEGTPLDNLNAVYSEGGGQKTLDLFTKGHGGDRLAQSRVGRDDINIASIALSCVLFTQPKPFTEQILCAPKYAHKGLTSRFMISCPEITAYHRSMSEHDDQPFSAVLLDDYNQRIRSIWQVPDSTNQYGEPEPYMIPTSVDAYNVLFSHAERSKHLTFDCPHTAALYGKARGTIARFAATLHLLQYGGESCYYPLDAVTMERGIALFNYHNATLQYMLRAHNKRTDYVSRFIKWVREQDMFEVTPKDLANKLRTWDVDKADLLRQLEDANVLRQRVDSSSGGRPSIRYKINPYLFQ